MSQSSSGLCCSSGSNEFDDVLERLLDIRRSREQFCVLSVDECLLVACQAQGIFLSEAFVPNVPVPCHIVGDVHGQFSDLLRILNVCGQPPSISYVFLGDYVDRGPNSVEVLMTLFIYKIKYPKKVHLLRGNHECARINAVYGFLTECTTRFSFEVYSAFNDCFANMPCAAIVAERIFCCHGGIVKDLQTIEEIAERNPRPIHDPVPTGQITELLWSDPNRSDDNWQMNYRGAGYLFGPTSLNEFLNRFKLDLLARAHEVMTDGYELFFDRKAVTIFSAPNYCNQFDNSAAVLRVQADYTCAFTIIRPISYNFPNTRTATVDAPDLVSQFHDVPKKHLGSDVAGRLPSAEATRSEEPVRLTPTPKDTTTSTTTSTTTTTTTSTTTEPTATTTTESTTTESTTTTTAATAKAPAETASLTNNASVDTTCAQTNSAAGSFIRSASHTPVASATTTTTTSSSALNEDVDVEVSRSKLKKNSEKDATPFEASHAKAAHKAVPTTRKKKILPNVFWFGKKKTKKSNDKKKASKQKSREKKEKQ